MSFAILVGRELYLTALVHDYQFQLQTLYNQKRQLSSVGTRLAMSAMNAMNSALGANSPEMQQMFAQRKQIDNVEKQVDVQIQLIQANLTALSNERESLHKAVTQEAKTFGIMGGTA